MPDVPQWAKQARQRWKYTGKERPPFADKTGPGEESVWDYPRPPKIDPDRREVIVKSGDILIAQSTNAVRILETAGAPAFYLPKENINMKLLEQSDRGTQCEWKGYGTYWHIVINEETISNAAWSYEKAFPEFESIQVQGMISFYPAKLECFVDGEQVRPQPGGFYGGWVTDEIVGPMKGEEGSKSWW